MFRQGGNRHRNTTNDVADPVEPKYLNNTSFEIHIATKNLQSVRAENRWNDFTFELEALNYDIALNFKRPIRDRSRVWDLLGFGGTYSGMFGTYSGNGNFCPKNA